ncbi:alpha/beta hydrolase [Oceanobacillus neutriphilus]|uniref:Esterase n=1 Tax=Oceanobacillus neutriphilus TaxID=531815 RepID=A0ABQ2NXU3_9BACI|nr:alpha/beta hydrolase [Oceanobacillus neutriphilus]GGP13129.1 esterase [Oceanobacillus neutriphilus]
MKTYTYKVTNNCEIKGTLHETGKKQAPLLMYIHGGGLIWGTRDDLDKKQVELYIDAGFNVFSIDYRLAPETKLPEIIEDIRDAIVWLIEEGNREFDFDTENIAVIGSSAGAYLALMTGVLETRPKAIVSFYGYGDITGDWYTEPSPHFTKMPSAPEMLANQLIMDKPIAASPIEKRYAIYLYCRQQGKWIDYVTGKSSKEDLSSLNEYCPARLADRNYPPTMLLHGDQDEDVPYQESVNMKQVLDEAGVVNQLITISGGKHTFDQNMEDPQVVQAFEKVIQFLKQQLS